MFLSYHVFCEKSQLFQAGKKSNNKPVRSSVNPQFRGTGVYTTKILATFSINWPLQKNEQSLKATEHLSRLFLQPPWSRKSLPELGNTDLTHLCLGFRTCLLQQHCTEDIFFTKHSDPLARALLCPKAEL